ncbi:ABC transporter substrate-binding protein [Paenibacillus donghaensis]|uniref:Ferrichrome ABC transporter substrate-binding protein n=1 Tax=Paenibacillus donghaensis TaxID=414771 RepID=A0A2Z2K4S1_9BACL|nr:ABC transporter substrate-binding protein [Paenibacillus donghaensis]ASA19427.1 ferrichrome ABC transporter substrate-binding protein [Paenibacillus donghaensis]
MTRLKQPFNILCMLVLMSVLLLACSSSNEPSAADQTSTPAPAASTDPAATTDPAAGNNTTAGAETRSYTDYMNHTVQIPTAPKRIVFVGETYGDLLALGLQAVGTATMMTANQIYEDQLQGVEDVGFPINLEKTLTLQPDLIIYADTDEADFEALSKIAPTVIFNTFAPLKERMQKLGDITGTTKEAEAWLADYTIKEAAMWAQLKSSGMKPGETASVFTYYPGDRLFVMAITGLSQVLYEENGFKPTPGVQAVLDQNKGFAEISLEVLSDYAGDRIFILNPTHDEAKASTDQLLKTEIWKNLPAVKNGQVYFQDIEKTSADATTRLWLLQRLPELLAAQ